jgi:tetratricopeptide (TPR) repeat protein
VRPGRGWLALVALASSGLAFANVEVGGRVPDPRLDRLEGGQRQLLAPGKTTLFVFFDPGHERCAETLGELAKVEGELAGAPVDWVGIVSERVPAGSVAPALAAAGARLDVVVDRSDALYGELGVRLLPSIGIADAAGVLRAYLPYERIGYAGAIRAHLEHALGRIDDAALAAALAPTAVTLNTDAEKARRTLTMAAKLYEMGKLDPALDTARKAAEADPGSAAAHALVGEILVAKSDCAGARPSLEKALALDPALEPAKAALARCP